MTIATKEHSHAINFTLEGAIVPKARPRVTDRGTFMPAKYRDWKEEAIADLICQSRQKLSVFPIDSCGIIINLLGKHSRSGDLDNVSGAILDALVQSGILRDDSMAVVTSLEVSLFWSREPPTVDIKIVGLD